MIPNSELRSCYIISHKEEIVTVVLMRHSKLAKPFNESQFECDLRAVEDVRF